MFGCPHNWDLIDKTLVKSGWTLLLESGVETKGGIVSPNFYDDRLVITLKCGLCGKMKTTVH